MSSEINVRVCVTTVWDTVELSADPGATTIEGLKKEALNRTTMTDSDIDEFQVKFRGALVLDESCTVGDCEIPDGASIVVLPTSKTPRR